MFLEIKVFCRKRNFTLLIAVLVCLCGATLLAGRVMGQGKAAKVPAGLTDASRAVIERLSSLQGLPDGTWKMHSGDLAHGEALHLDESTWQPIAVGDNAGKDTVWFRQTYQVPATLNGYDLSGARIWFEFQMWGSGPKPEILYFNGRRVAMGDDLEAVVLFDDARPGDKVTVAVKMLHTEIDKNFHGATLKIDYPANRPNPEDLRQEFLSAALLTPSLAPGDAGKMETVNAAIEAVDIAALDHAKSDSSITKSESQFEFDTSLKAARARLETLKPLLEKTTLHLTGNSHIDAAWLWPWTEGVDVVKRTYGTALQLMYEYPDYAFTQSAAAYNEWLAQKYPGMNEEIAQRIKEGRWEIVGGMWVEPDLNMPDGESLVRQLLVGKRWYKDAYGVDVRIGWNPDSFGFTWQLPQIYKKSGVDYFVTQKMGWSETNKLPFKLFWWESPDGSKVLTYFPPGGVALDMKPNGLSEILKDARERTPGMMEMMDLYGIGDHGGGPTREVLDVISHWTEPGHVAPKYEFSTAQSFFSSIEKQIAPDSPTWNYQTLAKGYTTPAAVAGKVSIPTWDSELYLENHRGVFTTQANHKRNMRDAEEQVLNAEKWSSLAWLDGREYPGNELTEDWKKVLFNQFHDLAAGSGIGVIYKDAQKDYDWVRMSTNEISDRALKTVAERIETIPEPKNSRGVPVIVFNSLGWERSGIVTFKIQWPDTRPGDFDVMVEHNSVIDSIPILAVKQVGESGVIEFTVSVPHVPAFGYEALQVMGRPAGVAETIRPTTNVHETVNSIALANTALRVEVDKRSGCVTSLHNNDVETLAPKSCGNQLQFFKDTPKKFDAWNIDPGTLDVAPGVIDKADSVELIDENTAHSAIRVTYHWQKSKFVQTISLIGDMVDIDNEIDWHETHVLLKAAFPLAALGPFATYEIPYGTIDRPTTRNNSWEKGQFEVPAMRWADLGDGKHGLSVINNSKYGYDAVGNMLRLSLLRSPIAPDPEADQGHHHFHYALYPHAGTWKDALTVRHGYEYNYPLTAVVTTAHAGSLPAEHSFASVGPENVVLTAVKKAEDQNGLGVNGLIMRAYEWAGKESMAEFHVPAGASGATVTNMMELPEGGALTIAGDVVKVPIHPYEILTIRVDYPQGGTK